MSDAEDRSSEPTKKATKVLGKRTYSSSSATIDDAKAWTAGCSKVNSKRAKIAEKKPTAAVMWGAESAEDIAAAVWRPERQKKSSFTPPRHYQFYPDEVRGLFHALMNDGRLCQWEREQLHPK